jgi:hypothetical protein
MSFGGGADIKFLSSNNWDATAMVYAATAVARDETRGARVSSGGAGVHQFGPTSQTSKALKAATAPYAQQLDDRPKILAAGVNR